MTNDHTAPDPTTMPSMPPPQGAWRAVGAPRPDPVQAVGAAWRGYVAFGGRSRRAEFWWFAVVCAVVSSVLGVLDVQYLPQWTTEYGGPLSAVWGLATFLPSLAVTVRRLHDTDRSAWWLLVGLVPAVGVVALLAFCALDGRAGSNRYGPSPKYPAPSDDVLGLEPPRW